MVSLLTNLQKLPYKLLTVLLIDHNLLMLRWYPKRDDKYCITNISDLVNVSTTPPLISLHHIPKKSNESQKIAFTVEIQFEFKMKMSSLHGRPLHFVSFSIEKTKTFIRTRLLSTSWSIFEK